MDEKTIARFWAKVDKRGPDECWEWQAGRSVDGYGKLRVHGLDARAHRIAVLVTSGPFNPSLVVRHRCDNPPCCNPSHLELGTHMDNVRDCVSRGRNRPPRGSANAHSRLSEEIVLYIRINPDRLSNSALASRFGVVPSAISTILSGRTWKHIPTEHTPRAHTSERRHWNGVLTGAERSSILDLSTSGWTQKQLAQRFCVSISAISRLLKKGG
jgi:hypothetical protein